MRNFKRVAIISDTHCGHQSGLTPPQWQTISNENTELDRKPFSYRRESWLIYRDDVLALRRGGIDCLIANGDLIDGRGERAGGLETLQLDRNNQAKMAAECLDLWKAKNVFIIRGTDYHTGGMEQWEDIVADILRTKGATVKIGDHDWIDVNGFIFDCKHHVGGSQIPHGRYTAIAREELWNVLWKEAGLVPQGDMIVRSHVHYHIGGWRCIGEKKRWFMTTPGLQGWTRYGGKRCTGTVDWGFIVLDIDNEGRIAAWHDRRHVIQSSIATAHRI